MLDETTNPPIQEPSQRGPVLGWLVVCVGLAVAIIIVALVAHSHGSKTSSNATATAPVKTATVAIDSQSFTPTTLNVSANTTVTWTAKDAGLHIVASNTYPKDDILPGLKSQQLGQNARYSYDFKKPGTYPYHDDLHPGINGTIVVK